MEILIALGQVVLAMFLIALGLGLFILIVILYSFITGSSVDPDDNGLLKTKAQKEKWRQEKLAKHKIEL
ncbi:hypothetical protein DX910_00560 [Acinetobacter haemolyticus]|nr:hypothetical protein DX910_00560 [Acinetobacter haemolyticus]